MERNSGYVLGLVPQHVQCSCIIQPPEVSRQCYKSEQVICYTIFIKDTQVKTSCVLGLEKKYNKSAAPAQIC